MRGVDLFSTIDDSRMHFVEESAHAGELWRRGEYIPMSLDPALARAAAVGVTVLTPEGQ